MLIDTHSHLNFNAYRKNLEEVIKRSLAENVWMINVGSKYETSKRAVEIAERYPEGIYAAVGLHPIHVADEEFGKERFKELTKSKKVVAIGEIGLDYYKDYSTFKEKQRQVFLEQLELAKELNLPVIFHCRKAHKDLLGVLNSQFPIPNSQLKGVIHCFTGTWKEAEEYLNMGFYLGINGIIYKINLKEVIEKTPLEKILIETDCPYLTPPEAEKERNEPIFIKYIAKDIARIKNISLEQVSQATTKNAKNLFNII